MCPVHLRIAKARAEYGLSIMAVPRRVLPQFQPFGDHFSDHEAVSAFTADVLSAVRFWQDLRPNPKSQGAQRTSAEWADKSRQGETETLPRGRTPGAER